MLRSGVDRRLAFGAVASAGTLASMIPPSILMIIYGVITNTPIGKLLMAGVIPGVVAALVFMTTVYILVKQNPALACLRWEGSPGRNGFSLSGASGGSS